MVTVIISTFIMGALYMILVVGNDSWYVNSVQAELQMGLRKATSTLISDLHESGSSSISDVTANGSWFNTLTFRVSTGVSGGYISWSNTIAYSVSSNQLQRVYNSATTAVSRNISLFQARRQTASPSVVEIQINAQKSTPRNTVVRASTSFQVQLRN